jgi:hypothetical protein
LVIWEWRVVFLECGVVCRPHVCPPVIREARIVLQLPLDLGTLDFIARKRPRHVSTRNYCLSDRYCMRRGGFFLQTELFLELLDKVCHFSSSIVHTGRVRGRTRSSSVAGAIVESSMLSESVDSFCVLVFSGSGVEKALDTPVTGNRNTIELGDLLK